MKIIILILFCSYGGLVSAAGKSWKLSLRLSNGTNVDLNLNRTDRILANWDTPVWHSKSTKYDDRLTYELHKDLKDLGKFDFYQNFDQKAAFIVFHDRRIVEGYVGKYYIKQDISEEYVTVPEASLKLLPPGLGAKASSVGSRSVTVYPKFLVHISPADVQNNLTESLVRMLLLWNRADMLFSNLGSVRVKLNIAGFIAPMDDYAEPWSMKVMTAKNIANDDDNRVFDVMDDHFSDHKSVFSSYEYDYIISFTEKLPGDQFVKVNPLYPVESSRMGRMGLVHNPTSDALDGIHYAIGNFFRADHDGEGCTKQPGFMSGYQYDADAAAWSSCSEKSIWETLGDERVQFLRDCPRTNLKCNEPDEPEVVEDVPQYPHDCVHNPMKLCQAKYGVFAGFQNMTCAPQGLKFKIPNNFESNFKHLSSVVSRHVRDWSNSLLSEKEFYLDSEGVMCDRTDSGRFSACVRGECVLINENIPECVPMTTGKYIST